MDAAPERPKARLITRIDDSLKSDFVDVPLPPERPGKVGACRSQLALDFPFRTCDFLFQLAGSGSLDQISMRPGV